MKINITIDLSDEDRTLIARVYGQEGKADRATCRTTVKIAIDAWLAEKQEQMGEGWAA